MTFGDRAKELLVDDTGVIGVDRMKESSLCAVPTTLVGVPTPVVGVSGVTVDESLTDTVPLIGSGRVGPMVT